MSQSKVAIITGTRPEIIKMQPVIKEVETRNHMELLFIHTGQHYDWNMSKLFIKELELPQPQVFLNVKSGSHGVQTARIIARSERVFKKERPDIVLVEGDTNSALGAALAAVKLKLPVGHVEAGCRSFDKNMPEETNRVLIADLAKLHFAPTETCVQNLMKEGISKEQIYHTGHPIVDLLRQVQNKINKKKITKFNLKTKGYYFVTVHREENVDNKDTFMGILKALLILTQSRPVLFPVHPRTQKSLSKFKLKKYLRRITATGPVSYLEALSLIKHARIVLTDSGGIQQEAALLETPCITLRSRTEWIETVNSGVNFLAKSEDQIITTNRELERDRNQIMSRFNLAKNIFGKPPVSTKIVEILEEQYTR